MASNNNLAGAAAGAAAAAAGAAAATNALMPGGNKSIRPAEKNLQTFYSTILKTDPVIFGHQFYITFSRY